jgi:predicted transglutaminase-like protease
MYIEQYLVKERHQERLRQAEEERAGRRIVKLRKLEKQQERAERALLEVWARVEQIHSIMSTG